jgi:hypothetical protein
MSGVTRVVCTVSDEHTLGTVGPPLIVGGTGVMGRIGVIPASALGSTV